MLHQLIFHFCLNHEITSYLYQAVLALVVVMIEILRVYDRGLFDWSNYDPPRRRSKSRTFIIFILADFYFFFFHFDPYISRMTFEFDVIAFVLFYPAFISMIKLFNSNQRGQNANS